MSDLISRSAFRRELIENRCFFPIIVKLALDAEPSVDAVKVVRCGECKHWAVKDGEGESEKHFCIAPGVLLAPPRTADFFCADGERKGNGVV